MFCQQGREGPGTSLYFPWYYPSVSLVLLRWHDLDILLRTHETLWSENKIVFNNNIKVVLLMIQDIYQNNNDNDYIHSNDINNKNKNYNNKRK